MKIAIAEARIGARDRPQRIFEIAVDAGCRVLLAQARCEDLRMISSARNLSPHGSELVG